MEWCKNQSFEWENSQAQCVAVSIKNFPIAKWIVLKAKFKNWLILKENVLQKIENQKIFSTDFSRGLENENILFPVCVRGKLFSLMCWYLLEFYLAWISISELSRQFHRFTTSVLNEKWLKKLSFVLTKIMVEKFSGKIFGNCVNFWIFSPFGLWILAKNLFAFNQTSSYTFPAAEKHG